MKNSDRQKLEQLKTICSKPSIRFEELETLLTIPFLREFSGKHACKYLMDKLLIKISTTDIFDFWRHLFRMHEEISPETLFFLWYSCFSGARINRYLQSVLIPVAGQKRWILLDAKTPLPPELAQHAITDPLLIDCAAVRHRYCLLEKPGWKLLRHADGDGKAVRKMVLPDILYKAIEDGSVPEFCIAMDMTGKKLSFSLLHKILWDFNPSGVKKLLCCILEKDLLSQASDLSVPELCCYLVSQFPDARSIPHLEAVEEVYPGILKEWRDEFDRNLLWYAMYNMQTGWFHPDSCLVPFLLEKGCDPENQNQLGLSWQYVNSHLTNAQKVEQMRKRYIALGIQGLSLKKEQPLGKIRK